jgi:hypothetical protein
MLRDVALGLTAGIALCGCAALAPPASPNEFREAVGKSSLAVVQSVDADKPYRQVADTLRKKAQECLTVTAHSSGPVFQGNTVVTEHSRTTYKPTVTETEGRTELAVQADFGNSTPLQKPPKDGFYVLVADATPAGTNATRITIYRGSLGKAKEIDNAIRAWARGESTACPNLSS